MLTLWNTGLRGKVGPWVPRHRQRADSPWLMLDNVLTTQCQFSHPWSLWTVPTQQQDIAMLLVPSKVWVRGSCGVGSHCKKGAGAQCWFQLTHTVSTSSIQRLPKVDNPGLETACTQAGQPGESCSLLSGTPISVHAHRDIWVLELGSPMLERDTQLRV